MARPTQIIISEHPSHNISGVLFTCYGCGKAVGDPLLAEECPTPDAVGLALGESIRQQAHRAIQREFDPSYPRTSAPRIWKLR